MSGSTEERPSPSSTGTHPAARAVTGTLLMAEGFLGDIFVSLTGGVFLTGVALKLGAGPLELSLLVGLPFLAQFGQLLGPVLEQRLGSRKRFVVPALVLGRAFWLVPTALVLAGAEGDRAVDLALVAVTLLATAAMVGANGWLAWMSEAIPADRRTRLFGLRTGAVAVGTLLATQGGAYALDHMKARGQEAAAYGILGAVAVLCGIMSARLLLRVPDVVPRPVPPEALLVSARRLLQQRGLRRILGFFLAWNLAIGLPAPFWSLFMLERLHMSFSLIALHASTVLLIRVLVNQAWSRIIERSGARRVLIVCSFGVSVIPLIWLFPRPDFILPIWVEACFSGVFWAGFNQAAFLAPLGAVSREDRSRGLAVFNLATGAMLFFSTLLGGVILQQVGAEGLFGFHVLFVLSALLRAGTGFLALRLGEPGVSVPVFLFHFIGYGVLRRMSWGRQVIAGDEEVPKTNRAG